MRLLESFCWTLLMYTPERQHLTHQILDSSVAIQVKSLNQGDKDGEHISMLVSIDTYRVEHG